MGGQGSGRKPKVRIADEMVAEKIKEYLQENAEIVDDDPEVSAVDIMDFVMNNLVKASVFLLCGVWTLYLLVRI